MRRLAGEEDEVKALDWIKALLGDDYIPGTFTRAPWGWGKALPQEYWTKDLGDGSIWDQPVIFKAYLFTDGSIALWIHNFDSIDYRDAFKVFSEEAIMKAWHEKNYPSGYYPDDWIRHKRIAVCFEESPPVDVIRFRRYPPE